MKRVLSFLSTKIGFALILALVVITVSVAIKEKSVRTANKKGSASLIVERIIKDSIANINEIDPSAMLAATSSAPAAPQSKAEADQSSYTATDRLSQELFKQLWTVRQNGQQVGSDVSSQIAENVLSQNYSDPIKLYSAQDVKTLKNPSFAAIKAYGNSLGSILSTPNAAALSEYDIFNRLSTESVDAYIPTLKALKRRYEIMRSKILALETPQALAAAQAALANSLTYFINSIDGAMAIDTDPIGSLGKIARYDDGIQLLQESGGAIQAYLRSNRVTYQQSEPGNVLSE